MDNALEEAEHWLKLNEGAAKENKCSLKKKQVSEKNWARPSSGMLKCNVHSSWINGQCHFGGAWILRDESGKPVYHARDAFLPVMNRISAELSCILWTIKSMWDLRVRRMELWSECGAAIGVLSNPQKWPLFRSASDQILQSLSGFNSVCFKLSSSKANYIARDIARSVTKEGRFNSYLALGGPAWLQNKIEEESRVLF
ncbi:putative protein phosphatase 2C-like protein 45 [Cardamine amara subsp. amara]|uniref:RNase H type-1 domain-containing protein n=1 Tax=Cardamine amara subsp. amara TaxID=228776 RepID=A0ABD1ASJ0_CARAN